MQSRYTSALLLSLVLLAACNKEKADNTVVVEEDISTAISNTMTKASEEARKEIISKNMTLGGKNGQKKAEITPQGDLLIEGRSVSVTAEQRALLINHRQLLVNIAVSGVQISVDGVNLAGEAVGEAFKSVFSGETDKVEKTVEAKAKKIEESAELLCQQLPLLLASQEKLANSLPEFKPYATMKDEDISDCHGKVTERK